MFLDSLDQVMSLYAPTDHTAGFTFQSYIDRLAAMENAAGEPLWGYVNVNTAVTSSAAATVQFQIWGNASDTTFASGNVVLADSGAIAKATLVAGYQIPLAMSRQAFQHYLAKTSFLRYLTIACSIGTTDLLTGKFNAWFTIRPPVNDALSYPAGYSV